jgi:hypothetical protein
MHKPNAITTCTNPLTNQIFPIMSPLQGIHMETHAALTTLTALIETTTPIEMIGITALIGTSIPNIILAAEANHQHPL